MDGLVKMLRKAEDCVKDHEPYHTTFQIDNFILGPAAIGPVHSDEAALGCYVQAQREIRSRISAIYSTKSLLCKMNMEIAQQEEILKKPRLFARARTRALVRAAAMAEIERLLYEISQTEASIRDSCRELQRFIEIFERYEVKVRSWSNDKRTAVETSQWALKFERTLSASSMCGSTDQSVIHTLLEMPDSARNAMLSSAGDAAPIMGSIINNIRGIEHACNNRRNVSGAHQHLSAVEAPRLS